jgi:hypothetical protein
MRSKDSLDRHFSRRLTAAVQGLHLPSEDELLRGMNFFRNDLDEDIREYAERLSRRIRKRDDPALASLAAALEELAVEQSEDGVQSLVQCLDGVEEVNGVPVETCRLRCQYYLASFGDPDAAASIASQAATIALRDINESDNLRMAGRALGWGVMARTLTHAVNIHGFHASLRSLAHTLHSYERDFEAAIERAVKKRQQEEQEASVVDALVEVSEDEAAGGAVDVDGSVVVFTSIGNNTTSEGKRVEKEFEKSVQRRLPLPDTADLSVVRTRLTNEFPWAVSIADEMLKGLVGREHVLIRPTILLGPPGCGKTRFSRRLVEELGVPYELVSCGGLSDSAIGGTPRRWSSGEPSLAVMAIRGHECAGPVIILDEIEKVGNSRHNGNVHDVLVGLLEKETSSRWFDPYVEATCDLSHITWLMTANEVDSVPAVLRDRCRILRFPEPGPDHLPLLASRILEKLYLEQGHDPRWATPLEGYEIEVLVRAWRGGSIRKVERLVEMLIETRERHREPQ